MPNVFVRRIALATVALPLLLGSCADDPPVPQMPETSSPTSEPTETESTSAPEPWDEQTEDGAVAFAEHWIDLLNDARLSSATEPVAAASTPECDSCSNIIDIIDQWQSDGIVYTSKPWTIDQVAVSRSERDSAEIGLRIFRPREVLTEPDGTAVRNAGSHATYVATVEWRRGAWLMHELVIPE
ncbi:DUF6318 family protein [Nocardioides sp. CF8]|uniref:DUF6318 family protein n=1 Tax=Nocardioides sp. CF8 TaxID=110319 RepID=UPI00041EFA24|nr:DUF6318 family protein [Nocardioides sp. CF8]